MYRKYQSRMKVIPIKKTIDFVKILVMRFTLKLGVGKKKIILVCVCIYIYIYIYI